VNSVCKNGFQLSCRSRCLPGLPSSARARKGHNTLRTVNLQNIECGICRLMAVKLARFPIQCESVGRSHRHSARIRTSRVRRTGHIRVRLVKRANCAGLLPSTDGLDHELTWMNALKTEFKVIHNAAQYCIYEFSRITPTHPPNSIQVNPHQAPR
jgi:hypothetical protein